MILFLFIFFIILNQKITLEICLFGIAIAAAVFIFMCRCMNYSLKSELKLYRLSGLFIVFSAVLVWEIIKANVAVAGIVLFRSKNYTPVIVHVSIPLKSSLTRTLMANSITLTPGTITVDENDGEYVVYCLDEPFSHGLEDISFCRVLKKMDKICTK